MRQDDGHDQRTALTETLDEVNALLTGEEVRVLNSKVEFDREQPANVASEFLTEKGAISSRTPMRRRSHERWLDRLLRGNLDHEVNALWPELAPAARGELSHASATASASA